MAVVLEEVVILTQATVVSVVGYQPMHTETPVVVVVITVEAALEEITGEVEISGVTDQVDQEGVILEATGEDRMIINMAEEETILEDIHHLVYRITVVAAMNIIIIHPKIIIIKKKDIGKKN